MPADIEREHRAHQLQPVVGVVPDRQRRADDDVERPELRVAPGLPGGQRRAEDLGRPLWVEEQRLPALGDLGGELDVLRPDRGPLAAVIAVSVGVRV